MTALKINPAKLPDRGKPTRGCRPKPWTIPEGVKVVKVGNKTLQTEHDAWKKKHMEHVKRSKRREVWNCTGRALIIPRLRRQWDGRNMRHVG